MNIQYQSFDRKAKTRYLRSSVHFRLYAISFYLKQTDLFETGDFAQSSRQSPVVVGEGATL